MSDKYIYIYISKLLTLNNTIKEEKEKKMIEVKLLLRITNF